VNPDHEPKPTGGSKPSRPAHVYLGERERVHERRTWLVVGLTAVTMVAEIAAGLTFGSMALLADGWHMASHAAALSITGLGFLLARRYARDPRFSFGTGKFGDLAGFASALILGLVAVLMAFESLVRLVDPVSIRYGQALLVACLGLVINLVSALLLKEDPGQDRQSRSLNLKAAYLHVLADALTSVLAIGALTAGSFLGWGRLDPAAGLVGAAVIGRWAYGLLRDSAAILLDVTPDRSLARLIQRMVEAEAGGRVRDLHLWRIGPGHFSAIVSVVDDKGTPPERYKELLSGLEGLSHVTIEVSSGEGTASPPGG